MGAAAPILTVVALQTFPESPLLRLIQRAVGLGEEPVLLVLDIFHQQGDVILPVLAQTLDGALFAGRCTFDGLFHRLQVRVAVLVFPCHQVGWAASLGTLRSCHQGKEVGLFLGQMLRTRQTHGRSQWRPWRRLLPACLPRHSVPPSAPGSLRPAR